MPDTTKPHKPVQNYEIRIYNETHSLHLHYPISARLANAIHFADIIGNKHAKQQTPGNTVTVMICSDIDGKTCAIWHRRYHDPATQKIIEMNETFQHAAEPDNQSSVSP